MRQAIFLPFEPHPSSDIYILQESRKQQSAGMIACRSPKSFKLVTNFRSHGGIVKCAHSIIALIMRFWPYAIDVLPQEKGIVDGIKPVFFSGWDQDNVRYESFLFGTALVHHLVPLSSAFPHNPKVDIPLNSEHSNAFWCGATPLGRS
jgi:hypothetical protein